MSVRIDATAAAHALTRAAQETNRPKATPTPQTASAPEREAALSRQLEDRLNTDIARIRQRVNNPTAPAPSSNGLGSRLDIRA